MNTMTYDGFSARIEFSADDECFIGHVAGIQDIVGFHADTVKDLQAAFHEAVDDYLQTCKQLSKDPEKPYSGKLLLRVPPEDHHSFALAAELSGISLNQWLVTTLRKTLNQQ